MDIPIVHGEHLLILEEGTEPIDPKRLKASNTRVAWRSPQESQPIYELIWENPRPDMTIESFDFIPHEGGLIILFAITVEP